ncbi:flagellar hook-associated protein FlgK [Pseudomonadales bacterium]|jgi:flagellar hook-associated protein FlgK|nr:flagellar hook-associated protein FlgK [Pseudomonadales bacterium]
MTDLLSIGANALKTNQSALAIVSNNIANVNTEGYVRQELDIKENLPTKAGLVYVGSGAVATGVRRAYDSFVESSVRSSVSDLAAQSPLIDYSNRMIDILGDQSASLTPALDEFFDGIKELSLDPSSELRRDTALSNAKGLASRFNELGHQLQLIDDETKNQLNYKVSEFNALTDQLAVINQKLVRQSDLKRQPPDLLNSRDQVLVELSKRFRVSVEQAANGMVSVTVGKNANGVKVVDGGSAKQMGVEYKTATSPAEATLVLDAYGDRQDLSGLTGAGGEIGGLLQFRSSVLAPSMNNLNLLAATVSNEVNSALSGGMDLYGDKGGPLFDTPLVFSADVKNTASNPGVSIQVTEKRPENSHSLELIFDKKNDRWLINDQSTGLKFVSPNARQMSINGLRIGISGDIQDGDRITIGATSSAAESMRVVMTDPNRLAAGDLYGMTFGAENSGSARASVGFAQQTPASLVKPIQETLVNNLNPAAAVSINPNNFQPLVSIPAGTSNVTLTLSKEYPADVEMQVFTREGQHLFGSAGIADSQLSLMLSENNGFGAGASYSAQHLNADQGYMGKPWRIGAVSQSLSELNEQGAAIVKQEAVIQSSALPARTNSTGSTLNIVDQADLKLNGKALSALPLANGTSLTSAAVVSWLNTNISTHGLALVAKAENVIDISRQDIDLNASSLSINGSTINLPSSMDSLVDLANAINQSTSDTNVEAVIGVNNSLRLQNTVGNEAASITLNSPASVFKSLAGEVRAAIKIEATRAGGDSSQKEVALTLSNQGTSSDLAALGFSSSLYIDDTLSEDLIVFATGATSASATLAADYSAGEVDPLALRNRITHFEFISDTQYQIKDDATGTVLATRDYLSGQDLQYQSIRMQMEGEPKKGDTFSVDGNRSGLGSNENALRLTALESKKVFGASQNFHDGYLSILTTAGNTSRLAEVAEQALEIVHDQAVRAKDEKSGVNLDEEAANLIRYQQAYQASARLMQTANQLFDALLRI